MDSKIVDRQHPAPAMVWGRAQKADPVQANEAVIVLPHVLEGKQQERRVHTQRQRRRTDNEYQAASDAQ